jgi:hypothetical protein
MNAIEKYIGPMTAPSFAQGYLSVCAEMDDWWQNLSDLVSAKRIAK